MKRVIIFLSLLSVLAMRPLAASAADAAAPALKAPSVEERLADLEAYVNNGARGSAANANLESKVGGPGPGHNGFQMICTALVLFMTLPGLALFYGGLVRRKNVLSVLAQCLGIAGLVTILWWLCGYSLAFAKGGVIKGRARQPRLERSWPGWTPRRTRTTPPGFRTTSSPCTSSCLPSSRQR